MSGPTIILFALYFVFAVSCGQDSVQLHEAESGQDNEETVAFTAAIDSNLEVQANQIVAFNKVLLNLGGGYNSKTGIFTASKSGVYVFHFHASTVSHTDFWIELYHNDEYVVSAFARQRTDQDTAGNSAILQMNKLDTVYLKAHRHADLFGRPNEIYTTLSGYRIGL